MLEINHLYIKYEKSILEDVCFHAQAGFFHLIQGESGCGKTSFLYRLGLLSHQCDFDYKINGIDVNSLSSHKKDDLRRNNIAFLLQNALLVEDYNVKENIDFFASISNKSFNTNDMYNILKDVGLNISLTQSIKTLSGGERQRLAIACALIKDTPIILLDEPTSSLDQFNEKEIFSLLKRIAVERNKCIVVSSHSKVAVDYADIIYRIENKELLLIKDKESNNVLNLQTEKFSFSQIIYYIKKHFLLLKKKSFVMIGLMCFCFLFVVFINYTLNKMQKDSVHKIINLSENQVFITSQNNSIYSCDGDERIDESIIKGIRTPFRKYPYIKSYMMLGNNKVDIIPYFHENDFSDKYSEKYNMIDDKGVILSQSVYKYLKRNSLTSRTFDNDIYVENHFINYQGHVKGILKEGVKNVYTNNDYFIYASNQVLEELAHPISQKGYTGYTLFTEDYTTYNQLIHELKQIKVDVNDNFININGINEIINHTKQLRKISMLASMFIILFMMIFHFLHHFNLRKREFVIDIVAGYSLKHIYRLIVIEILIYIVISFILFLILTIILSFLLAYNSIYTIIYSLLISLLLFLISSTACIIDMKKISVENILRD